MITVKLAKLALWLDEVGLKKEAADLWGLTKKSGIDFKVDEQTGKIIVSADPISLAKALGLLNIDEDDEVEEKGDDLKDSLKDLLEDLKSYEKDSLEKEAAKKKKKKKKAKKKKRTPTKPDLWQRAIAAAKRKFDVYPSAYANGWALQWYKKRGGGWRGPKPKR